MDVKSTFLSEILEEEVYTEQLEGFVDPNKRDSICKTKISLYGQKQAPRAWYERLKTYLMKIGFARTNDNGDLYLKIESKKRILFAKIFVDDIIFGGNDALCKLFPNRMRQK